MNQRKQPPKVYEPAPWDLADAAAVQACFGGTATPEQQQRAIKWIMYAAAGKDDVEYRTDPRDHAFASGRRFVGLQIGKMIQLNLGVFRENGEHGRAP